MLKPLDPKDFDRIYNIMVETFPPDELRPYSEEKALLGRPEFRIHVLKDPETDGITAFTITREFEELAYLEHFAVNPEYRNHGLGATLLQELREKLGKMIFLEVEPPEDEFALRRIGFYERNDFYFNPFPYIQPPMSAGRHPIPLYIMTSDRALTEEEFERVRLLLYTRVYCPD